MRSAIDADGREYYYDEEEHRWIKASDLFSWAPGDPELTNARLFAILAKVWIGITEALALAIIGSLIEALTDGVGQLHEWLRR